MAFLSLTPAPPTFSGIKLDAGGFKGDVQGRKSALSFSGFCFGFCPGRV
jgi:hypothetical protein